MKRAIFTFFASFLVGFSGAQMLPDSIEYYNYELAKEEYSATSPDCILYTCSMKPETPLPKG